MKLTGLSGFLYIFLKICLKMYAIETTTSTVSSLNMYTLITCLFWMHKCILQYCKCTLKIILILVVWANQQLADFLNDVVLHIPICIAAIGCSYVIHELAQMCLLGECLFWYCVLVLLSRDAQESRSFTLMLWCCRTFIVQSFIFKSINYRIF